MHSTVPLLRDRQRCRRCSARTRVALQQSFNPAQPRAASSIAVPRCFPRSLYVRANQVDQPIEPLPASLRLPITAGARIDTTTVTWFRKHLDRKVHSFYGSSENGGIAYDDSEDVSDPLRRAGHAGNNDRTPPLRGQLYGPHSCWGNAVASGYVHAEGDPVCVQ